MHTLRQQCLLVWQRHCFLLWIICILIRFSFSFLTVWFGRIGLNLWVSRRTPVILSYVVPTITSPAGGYAVGSLFLIILVCLLQARLLVLILLRTMLCHCVRIILFIMNGLEMRIYKNSLTVRTGDSGDVPSGLFFSTSRQA